MKIVKKTSNQLILTNLKEVKNRRKLSFRILIINLAIMSICFLSLPGSYNLNVKFFLGISILLLLIIGILLIRFDTSEADYFVANIHLNKLVHKRRNLFAGRVYIAEYKLKDIFCICIQKISVNSDDDQNYRVRLCFKSKTYLNISYFATPEKSFKVAKTISRFLNVPLNF